MVLTVKMLLSVAHIHSPWGKLPAGANQQNSTEVNGASPLTPAENFMPYVF